MSECEFCKKEANLRGGNVCDECAEDWWLQENTSTYDDGDEIETEIEWTWESPYAERGDLRLALISERRWQRIDNGEKRFKHYVPSALWDPGTPSA